eukprot:TRINITY_DN13232_c0_g1_i1.p1 TRINITY_DN13232_c0_g1~~TRINITY_DN13232_c0_g1_i1.p1  ORF type:complete len:150 (+),score=9.18 TRINITY_DN13232_c0_g1_i1:26-451(+)
MNYLHQLFGGHHNAHGHNTQSHNHYGNTPGYGSYGYYSGQPMQPTYPYSYPNSLPQNQWPAGSFTNSMAPTVSPFAQQYHPYNNFANYGSGLSQSFVLPPGVSIIPTLQALSQGNTALLGGANQPYPTPYGGPTVVNQALH